MGNVHLVKRVLADAMNRTHAHRAHSVPLAQMVPMANLELTEPRDNPVPKAAVPDTSHPLPPVVATNAQVVRKALPAPPVPLAPLDRKVDLVTRELMASPVRVVSVPPVMLVPLVPLARLVAPEMLVPTSRPVPRAPQVPPVPREVLAPLANLAIKALPERPDLLVESVQLDPPARTERMVVRDPPAHPDPRAILAAMPVTALALTASRKNKTYHHLLPMDKNWILYLITFSFAYSAKI